MNIDIHISQIAPGNPCKHTSMVTWQMYSSEGHEL